MKLLIISGLLLFSNYIYAGRTIAPLDNDRASVLVVKNKPIIKNANRCKDNRFKIQYKSCDYNINDYRTDKNKKMGCASDINRKNSRDNGDICN
ncbi:hypothetical protein [Yersinia kristensenii]|uniref:hypothetical protein n=1 Tax=Yersinia kristensenii TaxID=28152 RepID=UPI000BF05DD4|nr:hypothetical protein [Yersinia kristensenii]PEH54810.1 hypothetical protein CRM81_16835 [Yersinia kristensenii]SUP68688.1 Uncharacterised protein [Yersinia kristensenii]